MDPDELRKQLIEEAWAFEEAYRKGHITPALEKAKAMAAHVKELDDWLKRGGYVPFPWASATFRKRPS